jgi:hypothetical protein
MIKYILSLSFLLSIVTTNAQSTDEIRMFKATRVVNGHSVEVEKNGFLNFIISHRFGSFNDNYFKNFLGLDNATVRLGLDYGINDKFTIGAGRTTLEKTFDGYLKYQFIKQNATTPLTVTGLTSIAYRTIDNPNIPTEDDNPTNRTSYSVELLIAKQFKQRLGIQLSPTYLHRNLIATNNEKHDIFATGIAVNYKVSHRVDINLEWFYIPDGQLTEENTNPLSLGVDLGTNGHVFQLFVSNSQGMVSPLYLTKTTGTWIDGDIFFGFNIARVFRIKGHKA